VEHSGTSAALNVQHGIHKLLPKVVFAGGSREAAYFKMTWFPHKNHHPSKERHL
jgi:hypothetical protein